MSTESQEASTSQFAQLLGVIQRVEANVDAKLSSMKRELKEERESADDRLMKKIRLDSKPTFKKKGHEQQFVFNEQVRDKLVENVRTALDQTPPAVEKIRSLVNEGEKLLDKTAKTSAPIEEAVNSLSWEHTLAVAGAKRILAHKTCKKEPITAEILYKLYDRFVSKEAELPIIRTMTICLLGYAGFFRFNELASQKESDMKFYEHHVEVFVESSKTDQYREGAWVPIARTGSKICPVAMLERYWNLGEISGDIDRLLLRGLTKSKVIVSDPLVELVIQEFVNCSLTNLRRWGSILKSLDYTA